MKFSFMTWVCPDWDINQIIAGAKKYGYHGVELRAEVNHKHGVELEIDKEARQGVKERFATANIKISCLATSITFSSASLQVRQENMEKAKRYIELAKDVGSPYIRVFGGQVPAEVSKEDCINYVAGSLHQVGEFAKDFEVEVLLETHDAFSLAKDASRTIRLADSPKVNILWDVMHPFTHGETIKEAFDYVKDYVKHLHIHDAKRENKGWRLIFLGEGEIPYLETMQLLASIGFQGHLSVEIETTGGYDPDVWLSQYADKLREYQKDR